MSNFLTFSLHLSLVLGFLVGLHCDNIPILEYDPQLHFESGTFAEYLEDPLFYDGFLPLVYQFQVPKHMENAMKIMWQHATVCNASDSRYEGKLCPVVHHMHKVVANLSEDMGFWKDFLPPPTTDDGTGDEKEITAHNSSISTTTKGKLPFISCDEIRGHFPSHVTSQEGLSLYLKALEKCDFPPPPPSPTVAPKWIIDKQIYYTMIDRFYSEFYRTLPGTGNIDWVVTLNSYVSIQSLLLSNNFMESSRLASAFSDCRQSRIPQTFLKSSLLKKALDLNKPKIVGRHFKYIFEDKSIQNYYNLPIADCVFTEDYKFILRVLIPLRRSEVYAKLVQLRGFPFVERKGDGGLRLCQIEMNGMPNSLIESSIGLLFENQRNCKGSSLCALGGLSSYLPRDACESSVICGNQSLIQKQCPLACFPVEGSTALPLFVRRGRRAFVAVGSSDHKLFIQCNGQPLEKIVLVDVGALEIELSCSCQISYRSLVLGPLSPCEDEGAGKGPKVRHILPLHWESFLPSNSSQLNSNSLEQQVSIIFKSLEQAENKRHAYQTDGQTQHSASNPSSQKASSDKQIYIQPHAELSTGLIAQMSIIWILIVGLAAVVLFLGWNVHSLNKWKKLELYKDTRIVYNVPDSPQFPSKF